MPAALQNNDDVASSPQVHQAKVNNQRSLHSFFIHSNKSYSRTSPTLLPQDHEHPSRSKQSIPSFQEGRSKFRSMAGTQTFEIRLTSNGMLIVRQMLPGTNHSRAIARSGVDWVCVDCEHGNIDGAKPHAKYLYRPYLTNPRLCNA